MTHFTRKSLSSNALLPEYRWIMDDARITSPILSLWRLYATLLLNSVTESAVVQPNFADQTYIESSLRLLPQRTIRLSTRERPDINNLILTWNAQYRQHLRNIRNDNPDLHAYFERNYDTIKGNMVGYSARSIITSIKNHLSSNYIQFVKRCIVARLKLLMMPMDEFHLLVSGIERRIYSMKSLVQGPLNFIPESDYIGHPCVVNIIDTFRPTALNLINGYEHYCRLNPNLIPNGQYVPLYPRQLTAKKLYHLLKRDFAAEGPAAAATVIIREFKDMRDFLREVNGKVFNLLPKAKFRPGYVKYDRATLRMLHNKEYADVEIADMINYKHFQLHNKRENLSRHVSINTDGYSISVSFGKEVPEPDDPEDEFHNHQFQNVDTMRRGYMKLEDVDFESLNTRIGNGANRVYGLDPGVVQAGTSIAAQLAPTHSPNVRAAEKTVQLDGVKQISNCHWQNLMMKPSREASVMHIKSEGLTAAETRLSLAQNFDVFKNQLFQVLPTIIRQYARPFFRKWRSRMYATAQSTKDKAARYFIGLDGKPAVPLKNDHARHTATNRRRAAARVARLVNGEILDPDLLPPIVGYGDGSWDYRRWGRAKVPNISFAKRMAEHCLVLVVPEYNTTRTLSRCNHVSEPLMRRVSCCDHRKRRYVKFYFEQCLELTL
jgi:hypothetical protein